MWDGSINGGLNDAASIKPPNGIAFGAQQSPQLGPAQQIGIFQVWREGDIIIAFAGDTIGVAFLMTKHDRAALSAPTWPAARVALSTLLKGTCADGSQDNRNSRR